MATTMTRKMMSSVMMTLIIDSMDSESRVVMSSVRCRETLDTSPV